MKMSLVFTSDWILKQDDLHQLQEDYFNSSEGFEYQMNSGEIQWFENFVKGRYEIADWIEENLVDRKGYIIRFQYGTGLNEALICDDCGGEAPMLSDDSALAKIFFYLFEG